MGGPDIDVDLSPGLPNYGFGLAPQVNAAVGVASSPILAPNNERVGVTLSNVGPMDVWMAFDHPAEVDKGICLQKGSTRTFGADMLSRGELNAIVFAGTTSVSWQEFVRMI